MNSKILSTLVRQGLAAMDDDDIPAACRLFEEAVLQTPTPVVLSCLGYCQAHEGHDLQKAFDLCRDALRQEPGNPLHYLNLGRVYLLAGNKPQAVKTFRKGLKYGRHPGLIQEIQRLGMRRPLVFPALGRDHLLNRLCGFFLSRLGLRSLFHRPEKFRRHHH